VTSAATSEPIAGIEVCAYETAPPYTDVCKTTSETGGYTIDELPAGSYEVSFFAPSGSGLNYAEQAYPHAVSVSAGAITPSIDAALVAGAEVTGKVIGEDSKAAVKGIEVCAYPAAYPYPFFGYCSLTNESGEYAIAGLSTGEYKLQFFPPRGSSLNYISQYYPDMATYTEAEALNLTAGTTTAGVDATLVPGGEISGRAISAASSVAIAGLEVCAYPLEGEGGNCVQSEASGAYTIPGLSSGNYRVEFTVPSDSPLSYLTQYYDEKRDYSEAESVAVTVGAITPNINAAMQPGGTISGTVTAAPTKSALANVYVCASVPSEYRCAITGSSGEYAITSLPSGSYAVDFYGIGEYASQYYKNKVYAAEAEEVSVTAESTSGNIDAEMQLDGKISGVVTSAATSAPLEGVSVCRYAVHEEYFGICTSTNAQGEYSISGLAATEYKIEFSSSENYLTQYYNGKDSLAEADTVAVTPGEMKSGIDGALQPGGAITGTITSAKTKQPVAGATVTAYDSSDNYYVTSTTTNAKGEYALERLTTGSYKVGFNASSQNLVPEYYEHERTLGEASTVSVTAGATMSEIDAELQTGGQITGRVTSATSKEPLAFAYVSVESSSGETVGEAFTDESGDYEVSGLAEGTYKVEFSESGFENQFYSGKDTSTEADAVTVTAGATTEHINAAMRSLASISGTVTAAATHSPVSGVEVCAYSTDAVYYLPCVETEAAGKYTISGLSAGSYTVGFYPGSEYLEQSYDGKSVFEEATPIAVSGGEAVTGINAELQAPGHIVGEVTSKTSGLPLAEIQVCAESISNGFGGCATTGSDGQYEIGGLATGSYRVEFVPPEYGETSDYLSQYYDGKAKASEANSVAVTAGTTTEAINAALSEGGEISGKVTSASGKAPLDHAAACAYLPAGEAYHCGYTDSEGEYTITGLPNGKYVVYFFPTEGEYSIEYYNGVTNANEATLVGVSTGTTTSGIDGQLHASGRISGTITSVASGNPVSDIEVCALSTEGVGEGCTDSEADGKYTLLGVAPGKHKVEFASNSQSYETQYYNDKSSLEDANPVEVSEATTTEGINAAMVAPGEVTGRVTNEAGTSGIAGIQVCAYGVGAPFIDRCADTASNGEYQLSGLASGSYKVQFYAPHGLNYIEQYYPGKSSYEEGETVIASSGTVTGDINAALRVGGEITGQVTAAKSGADVAGVEVCSYAVSGYVYTECATTEASGQYTIEKLPTDEYRVGFADPFNSSLNYIRQFYSNRAHLSEGQKLPITAGVTTSGINATLEPGGEVSGKVIRVGTKAALNNITVCPLEHEGYEAPGPCVLTNASGEYTLRGLPPGLIDVEFSPDGFEYVTQYYKEAVEQYHATAVPVEVLRDTTGINAALKSTHPLVPEVLSPPTISGTAQQGEPLTEHHGSWTNSPIEYRYQWFSCDSLGMSCLPIEHTEGETYTPVAKDVGSTLEVQEIAVNLEGESEPAMSEPTAVVVPAKPANISPPEITGEARAGATLTEQHGKWTNEPTAYSYQWERCSESGSGCIFPPNSTEESYKLGSADVGHTIRVIETAINAGGESQPAVSAASAVVVPEVPVNVSLPSISGPAVQGQSLEEVHGKWTNEPTEYSYQWERCSEADSGCVAIPEATSGYYQPTSEDVGHRLVVAETAHNAGGASKPAASGPTAVVVGAVPVDVTPPTISGQARVGGSLMEQHGDWTNEPTAYSYQWERCTSSGSECKPIFRATEQSYVPEAIDAGHELVVEEVAANATGPAVKGAESAPTAVIVSEVPMDITPPTISGMARQGETLKEAHGSWTNEPTSYDIQWQRCDTSGEHCTTVEGGTEDDEYQLTANDLGHTILVVETASNAGGPGEPATSEPTARVVAAAPVNTSPPTISGRPVEGETLTEHHGGWTNEPSAYEYQWERCSSTGTGCLPIEGATEQTYVLGSADVGHTLVVVETASNAGGPSKPQVSAPTLVISPPVPVNTAPPKISGSAYVGSTLMEEHGEWTNEPSAYEYQWERCNGLGLSCLPIKGQTHQTYEVTAEDMGYTLVVKETASNAAGPGTPVASNVVGPVTVPPPTNITTPKITGTPESGQTLLLGHGSWTNSPSEYHDQWLRCNASGEGCTPIHDAINLVYAAAAADIGYTLRVQETARNSAGPSEPATSEPTAVVTASPLHADAGENIETTVGTAVTFDGSGSTPEAEITGYRWEFGDGGSAEAAIAHHSYAEAGSYTATLTVERGSETRQQSIKVIVAPKEHVATVTVVDEGKQPIEGAEVLYMPSTGGRIEADTDAAGQAALAKLPDGADTVYVYREGYKPAVGQVTVSGGSGEATVTLASGPLAEAKLTDHEMTKQEIEEAGINPNEPGNNLVYHAVIQLKFGPVSCDINERGEFVALESCTGGSGGSGFSWSSTGGSGGGVSVTGASVDGHTIIETLELGATVSMLKQFFAVSMVVNNLSGEPFKFTHGTASLTVPAGMSLAPTPTPQSATQSVPDIPGGGSAESHWILRGDEPGEYYLSASYHGQLEPFEAPLEVQAATSQPLKVWGAEALGFRVQADEGALKEGNPYHVRIGVYDKAPIPLYNVAIAVNGSVHDQFIFQPDQQFEAQTGELKPGETLDAPEDILVPAGNSGAFEPEKSSVYFVGESVHPGKGIEAISPPPLYTMTASLETATLVHLHWQPSPSAEGYEVYSTPNLETPFGGEPDAVQTSPTDKTTVTRLPASATDAYITRGSTTEPPRFYAVTSIIGGQLRLEHPVREPSIQGPVGGPLTLRELLAGASNPSEFCLQCAMNRITHGDPVDAPTGNFWHSFTDLSIPGRGIPLSLTRTYNSGAASTNGPFGYGWSFTYGMNLSFPDASHVVVNQEDGSTVTFTEEPDGSYTAPPRVTATLVHNSNGSWTFVRHRRDTFSFNSSGQLTAETDLNGYTTALAYNEKGQLSTVTDPAGRKLKFKWKKGHIVSVTDPMKRTVEYEYDSAGNLVSVIDVAGGETHFSYDSQHRMLTMRLPNQAPGVPGSTGAVISNVYDEEGRVIEQTDQLGRTTKFAYSGEPLGEAGGSVTITDPKGNVTLQTYQFGELTSETKGYGTPEAATWKFEYEQSTLGLASVTDPNGHTTRYTYDSEGNTLTTEDALGRKTVNTYDALNDQLTSIDPMGVTTTMTYDAHGNLLSRSRPLIGTSEVETTTYTYGDPSDPGDVTAMTDPEGHIWHYAYDKYGDLTSTTDPDGDETTSTYNADGWKLSEVSPRGNASGKPAEYTTSFAYNSFGQVIKTVDPLGHTTTNEYDPDQNLIATTDPDGNTTRYSYDAAGEQIAVQRANGSTTRTTYWPDGSVKEQINAGGHATRYEYNALGQQIAVTDPLGRTTRYTYDGVGNELTMTDPEGQVTTMTYDADNEQTSISYSDSKTPNVSSITYNTDGERTGMTDGTGTWTWNWDSLHRLTSATEGNNGTVSYRYDLRGLPTEITYPNGKTVARSYDTAGRLTSVKDWHKNVTMFHYNADGDLIEQVAAGITDHFSFNQADETMSIADDKGTTSIFTANYTRDADGQLTSDSSAPSSQDSYAYTALNQLCYAGNTNSEPCTTPPSGASAYKYDESENLTQNGETMQAFDAANQLCWSAPTTSSTNCAAPPVGATTYSYNARGDRIGVKPASEPVSTLSYDQANQLTGFTQGGTTASYTYNGDGLRMSKIVNKKRTDFAWDESEELPLLLEAGKTAYVYGPEGLAVEQITGSKAEWLHHDQLGSTRLITNSSGAVTGTYTYNPWGKAISHTGTATTSLQFDGQYTDAESGYQYLRARYYDPGTGQFLTVDPAVEMTDSPYGYASDDPLNAVDMSGLWDISGCFIVCASYDSHNGWGVGVGTPGVEWNPSSNPNWGFGVGKFGGDVIVYGDGSMSATVSGCWGVCLSPTATARGSTTPPPPPNCVQTCGVNQQNYNMFLLQALNRRALNLKQQLSTEEPGSSAACSTQDSLNEVNQQIVTLLNVMEQEQYEP